MGPMTKEFKATSFRAFLYFSQSTCGVGGSSNGLGMAGRTVFSPQVCNRGVRAYLVLKIKGVQ